jgi:hypothetical protein
MASSNIQVNTKKCTKCSDHKLRYTAFVVGKRSMVLQSACFPNLSLFNFAYQKFLTTTPLSIKDTRQNYLSRIVFRTLYSTNGTSIGLSDETYCMLLTKIYFNNCSR